MVDAAVSFFAAVYGGAADPPAHGPRPAGRQGALGRSEGKCSTAAYVFPSPIHTNLPPPLPLVTPPSPTYLPHYSKAHLTASLHLLNRSSLPSLSVWVSFPRSSLYSLSFHPSFLFPTSALVMLHPFPCISRSPFLLLLYVFSFLSSFVLCTSFFSPSPFISLLFPSPFIPLSLPYFHPLHPSFTSFLHPSSPLFSFLSPPPPFIPLFLPYFHPPSSLFYFLFPSSFLCPSTSPPSFPSPIPSPFIPLLSLIFALLLLHSPPSFFLSHSLRRSYIGTGLLLSDRQLSQPYQHCERVRANAASAASSISRRPTD